MFFKKFDFESFDKWVGNKKREIQLGDYIAEIGVFSYGCNGNTINTYCAALACRQNPHNVYSSCIYREIFNYDHKNGNIEELKMWYEKVCEEINLAYKEYMRKNYFISSQDLYIALARGDEREEYIAIGFTEEQAKINCIKEFFKEDNHTEAELNQSGYEITVSKFSKNHMSEGI